MSHPSAAPRPDRRGPRLLRELWVQVIIAAILGIAVGLAFPGFGAAMKPLSDWFIALVKMIVAPVIFCVVTSGIASMDDVRRVGRIGVKAIGYFIAFSLISMLIGLVVANIFRPGAGMHIDPHALHAGAVPKGSADATSFTAFVSSIIPDTMFSAFTSDDIVGVLFVSILFGFALNAAGPRAEPLAKGIRGLSDVVFRIVSWIMKTAPIGTFGALAAVVSTYGLSSLRQLGYLIVLFTVTCVIYIAVVLGGVMRACRMRLVPLMRYLKDELLIVLSTCSSESVLPQVVAKLERLGVGRPVVGITIPAGSSFNLDGSAIYLTMGSLFVAQAVDVHLSLVQQLVMVGIMMLTSKGTAGVAGGAFVVLASSVTAFGHIPLAALALIVGIDRILNEGRVFINVLGNAVAAIVVGKWEGDFDAAQAAAALAGDAAPTGGAMPEAAPAR
jgi:aerobic C4-dicarboxylate transport protein